MLIIFNKHNKMDSLMLKNPDVEFIRDIEELMPIIDTYKCSLVNNLKKNYKENIHYIIKETISNKDNNFKNKKRGGGQNKIVYKLNEKNISYQY